MIGDTSERNLKSKMKWNIVFTDKRKLANKSSNCESGQILQVSGTDDYTFNDSCISKLAYFKSVKQKLAESTESMDEVKALKEPKCSNSQKSNVQNTCISLILPYS